MIKKLLLLVVVLTLTACQNQSFELPNLEGKTLTEIERIFDGQEYDIDFIERTFVIKDESNVFISYGMFLNPGDQLEPGSYIPIIVSASLIDESIYFVPQPITYDGPRLDDKFYELGVAIRDDNTVRGVGGLFSVELQSDGCVDGDTAKFVVPEEMVAFTNNPYVRSRFLNFDTPETFSGGEQVFGQPASQYACELLTEATQIILQTDPGDNLFDRYGRLLAWIWIQTDDEPFQLLNYMMVRQGLGIVRYLYGAGETDVTMVDGLTYTEWMYLAEERAMAEKLGRHGELLDYYWDYEKDAPNPYTWP